jgi:phosphoglycolate phosphatase
MLLLFDLDGTLTDSAEGVTRCLRHALVEVGAVVPPAEELRRFVGPPLPSVFQELVEGNDPAAIDRAIKAYRERFEAVGMYENHLYPGIADALATFDQAGHMMRIVTAKPRVYAERIAEHFDIAKHFQHVHGPALGARGYTKASLIHEACVAAPELRAAAMVGDRAEDVLGARSSGVAAIAVAWGYGHLGELRQAAPDRIVESVTELVSYIQLAA